MRKNHVKLWFIALVIMAIAILPYVNKEPSYVNASEEYGELGNQINKIMNDKQLDGAVAGVSLRSATSGEILYEHFGDMRLRPASNMKLLTAAAALETLGENYQFTTELLTDGQVKGKVLQGNLYLKGKGDPTLLKEDLDQFADELKEKGIKQIHGDLIGDDTWYDDVRLSQDLNWTDETEYYGAQVSALTLSPNTDYDTGTVIVDVNPASKDGKPAEWKLTPETNYVKIINKAVTVAKDGKKDITIQRKHGTNTIVVEGTIPVGASAAREWMSVWEPAGYVLDVFKHSLEEKGIRFIGQSVVQEGKTPNYSVVLTDKKSMPLKEIFIPFMKLSNNGHAEMLTKEMGKVVHGEGSWEKGLDVIRKTVSKLGVNTGTLMLRDGSGMSHVSMIPANEITKLLFAIQQKSWYPAYLASLPVAGESDRFVGGTLRNRMKEPPVKGNVIAKTGSLTAVSTLSGYVKTKSGEPIIFSILINNYVVSSVTGIQDRIATLIANYDTKK
ncbi:D-alanyl-D-alanine carboxypeptidase/D-alanyl-D-alanine endopeptidase [Heyndrickxia sp. NPDC080065]|uniref:D-alanyl-D-alanine carboxypeptidase/D-alanyl-D-alanine endopeptidase n=1 Tax=Heyndrickxia sp. NPDC080065 TaxID=3390568 RepID=UPI003D06BACB